ncbi:hypothetical protein SGRA_2565 [Saprospira grandis str. Lewin]|uniref:Uncharacterized protein n=1 Tax=Saprospira grandis (strain Lewin) TaxID=984262 RepID=H6L6P7_SAPGL|nr:hypothetical protein SGRA_2565 [Saprospira grandis str. Lewin]
MAQNSVVASHSFVASQIYERLIKKQYFYELGLNKQTAN